MGRRSVTAVSKPIYRTAKLWVPVGIVGVLATVGVLAAIVASDALAVKEELESAIPLAKSAQELIVAGDSVGATQTAAELAQKTSSAVELTQGGVWQLAELVPVLGPNLVAVRTATEVADELSASVVTPLSGVSVDAIKPSEGRFDLEAIAQLSGVVAAANKAVIDADAELAAVGREGLLEQVTSALDKLQPQLDEAKSVLGAASAATEFLPNALGANGPRNYLMVMQGTAEARASGGGAGVFILLTADNGTLNVSAQHASADFDNNLAEPIVPLDAESLNIYSPILGTYITNLTGTPDWPTSAALAQGWWSQLEGQRIDGVGSFDPVALGYLLGAAGPVTLATGDQINAENAAPLLLSEVYGRYPESADQDAFFEAAAVAIFDGITNTISDPKGLVSALAKATDEGRLKFWSANPEEQAVISSTKLGGILPTDNAQATVMGAYFNDTTGSKMDYYVDATVSATSTQCEAASPTFTETITLSSSISAEAAATLPLYVTGPYYEPGFIATDILVYGPVGSTIASVTVNGAAAAPVSQGTHFGRPVARISHVLPPLGTATVVATMTGAAGEYGPLEIRTTPLPRATPLSVDAPDCT